MEIFKFEKEIITRHIEYELKTFSKLREPFNYVVKSLEKLKNYMVFKSLNKININKVKEKEGKNYHWSVFTYKNVTLLVRRYRYHLTIFTKVIKDIKREDSEYSIEYGAFTLNTDFEKFGDKHDEMMDAYYDKPFTDLNAIMKNLINLLIERGVHWVSNSACLKVPNHVKIELAFCSKNISSLDSFVFCMEELENIYQTLFAEITMIKKLKEYKTGDVLGERYKIGKVITEVKDEYYHAVGMETIDIKNKDEKSFRDVYCLTRWYFDEIFKEKTYLYNGEIYVEGGSFKVGEPVAYKNMDDSVTSFKNSYPKENLIPLKKY